MMSLLRQSKLFGAAWILCGAASVLSGCVASEEDVENLNALFAGGEGSGYNDPPNQPGPGCFSERFVQPEAEITKKIDILFVTDTSGSLDVEREAIALGIDGFVQALPGDVDFRIGVMLAHGSSVHSGSLWRWGSSSPWVLDSEVHTLPQIREYLRQRMLNVATEWQTDGGEAGLFSLHKALTPAKLAESQGRGFFRSDAALAVVFVADENDICAEYPSGVTPVPDLDQLEGPARQTYCVQPGVTAASVLQEVKTHQGERPLLISGIIYNNPQTVVGGGENEVGYGYTDIIALANGVSIDLANGDYTTGLGQIGTLATIRLQLVFDFTLANANVNAATLEVEVDGVPAQFNYMPLTNEVHIPQPGGAESVVDIYYCLNSGSGGGGIGI